MAGPWGMALPIPGPFSASSLVKFNSSSSPHPLMRCRRLSSVCSVKVLFGRMAEFGFKLLPVFIIGIAFLFPATKCGHFLNADGTPHDMHHDLHVPRNPALYPTYDKIPKTSFSCEGKQWGYHADTEAQCQVYHLCQGKLVQSFLCPNATLFHNQFKACDQFYNVRCGVDLEDL